jgi:hypothetical protein
VETKNGSIKLHPALLQRSEPRSQNEYYVYGEGGEGKLAGSTALVKSSNGSVKVGLDGVDPEDKDNCVIV